MGSGIFAEGYKLSIEKKDNSTYTVASIGNYQINESCSPTLLTKARPEPIEIYEFEGCPFCRKVREGVSILNLKVLYKPCPKDGRNYRNEIKTQYGPKSTFPFMNDPNTGVTMFESDDILNYLFKTYGDGEVPSSLTGAAVPLTAGLGLLPRFNKGGQMKPSRFGTNKDRAMSVLLLNDDKTEKSASASPQPLILWSYEGSPFCKIVREELCELEIPHVQISTPRGSPNRQLMMDRVGRFQAPYLEDPNEDIALWESEAIVEYLQKRYGLDTTPVKYL